MSAMPSLAVEASGLTKSFGTTRAVDGLDLTVPHGAVYGVLGPNGSGKTTTIRMLAALLRPDSGIARVFGHDVTRDADEVRSRIGLTGQHAAVDEDLTGHENLLLLARLAGYTRARGRARTAELLAAFGLDDAGGRLVKTYSGGMRRRLDIAAPLVAPPQLLFLDEPTTGLDPRSRAHVWKVVRALAAAGTTVLLTTQYLDEADRLADRVAVIDRGTVIREGTPGELKALVGVNILDVRLRDPAAWSEAQRIVTTALDVAVHPGSESGVITAHVAQPDRVPAVLVELRDRGIDVTGFALGQPSLDEVFLELTADPATTTIDAKTKDGS